MLMSGCCRIFLSVVPADSSVHYAAAQSVLASATKATTASGYLLPYSVAVLEWVTIHELFCCLSVNKLSLNSVHITFTE